MDVWLYIHAEKIPIVPLYFAKEREAVVRGEFHSGAAERRAPASGRKAAEW